MITVYLDSQDYSNLSKPQLSPEHQRLKEQFLAYKEAGRVRFVFSCLVVCEAAPTEMNAIDHAIRRGELLTLLCGRNALIEHGELSKREAEALSCGSVPVKEVESDTGDWFPLVELDESEPVMVDATLKEQIRQIAMTQGLDRRDKRKLERKATKEFNKNSVSREFKRSLAATSVAEIMNKYPMKEECARVFHRYTLGEASKEEATAAYRESLRDPCWLMRWFASGIELADHITEVVRKPGRELGAMARDLVAIRDKYLSSMAVAGFQDAQFSDLSVGSRASWARRVDELVIQVVNKQLRSCGLHMNQPLTSENTTRFCPGISAVVRSLMWSIWDNIGGSRKEAPSDSQAPDAMHAMYAPYVDIFRADKFMAPHIQKQVEHHGTLVASKLLDLPKLIESRLSQQG